jgi:hypothetical protein
MQAPTMKPQLQLWFALGVWEYGLPEPVHALVALEQSCTSISAMPTQKQDEEHTYICTLKLSE